MRQYYTDLQPRKLSLQLLTFHPAAVHKGSCNSYKLLDKLKPESTGGLPKYITVAINHQYDIISNIAVNDGIMNGAECCIKFIQPQTHNTNFPAIIWVQFEELHVGKAQCQKYSYLQSGWTYTAELDSYICTEENISDQGCVGYMGPIPTSLCCSMYNTCYTKCNILSYLHRYEHKHKPPKTLAATYALCCLKLSNYFVRTTSKEPELRKNMHLKNCSELHCRHKKRT